MRISMCRPAWLLVVSIVVWGQALSAATVTVNSFSDLLFWTGSGTNASALVLQFGDEATPTSIAWGYRWDEPVAEAPIPTVADMVFALTGADPRLAIAADFYPEWNAYFVNSFSYDQTGLPIPWSQSVRDLVNDFDNDLGIAFYAAVADPLNPSGPWPQTGLFSVAASGMAGTPLANGSWYGFVVQEYDAEFAFPATVNFTQPVSAVPEPGTWAFLVGAAVVAGCGRAVRRRRVDRR